MTVELQLSAFEQCVLQYLLDGDHPTLWALRRQLTSCQVASREFTGVGFFLDFKVVDVEPLHDVNTLRFGDVVAELRGVNGGAGFLLFVDDGYIVALEGYVFAGTWPEETEIVELRYDSEPQNLDALSVTQER